MTPRVLRTRGVMHGWYSELIKVIPEPWAFGRL